VVHTIMHQLLFIVCLVITVVNSSGPVELSEANFDNLVVNGGKNSFVKFFAPWCGHCKAMKPAWDKIGEDYAPSSVLVGDVDCTQHEKLCSKYSVSGYPTLKYWKDGTMHDYSGGRDDAALRKFIKDTLEVLCNVNSPKDCSDKEKAFIEAMKAKPAEITSQLTRLQGMASAKAAPALKEWLNQRINILRQLEKK